MNSRKTYSSDLKSRVVLEMFREEMTVSQISSKYGVHQSVLNKWRNTVIDGLPGLFADPRKKKPDDIAKDNVIEDLYRQVGKLSLQLEWLKKKCGVDAIPQ
jgi:transposase-like protein